MEVKGFVVTDKLPQDKVTLFGKSQPDVTIYRSQGGYVKENTIVSASICTGDSWEVIGATIELKKSAVHLKRRSAEITQTCANMVRVAGFLTEKALAKGLVVEEITIFGLLVSHTSPHCIPLRYHFLK